MEIYLLWSFFAACFVSFFLVYFYGRKKKLDPKTVSFLIKKLKSIQKDTTISEKERLVVLDTLFHHVLKALGYHGSFGEILKKSPKEIQNIDEIWRLHKMRNKLVHDIDYNNTENLQKEALKYGNLIEKFLYQIKA